MTNNLFKLRTINLKDIALQAEHSVAMMSQVRAVMLNPTSRKKEPTVNLTQLADLCGTEKG